MNDLISKQEAIKVTLSVIPYDEYWAEQIEKAIQSLPPTQPTLYGYDIESLKTIAMILEKENMPPEKVTEVLTDIWRIVALIIQDEFEKSINSWNRRAYDE